MTKHYLVPARGGSKTILDKNLVGLGDFPLVQWTLEAAKEAAGDAPVVVSSDDEKILAVAEACGVGAHVRPRHLADDQATMKDVVREYLRRHPEAEDLILLYPTVPFRTAASIRTAVALYDEARLEDRRIGERAPRPNSLMSVHASHSRPYGGLVIANGRFKYEDLSEAYYRKQDTPALYHANGAIYIINRNEVERLNTQLFNAETMPFVMAGHETLDIDTPQDLETARALVTAGVVRPGDWRSALPAWTTEMPVREPAR